MQQKKSDVKNEFENLNKFLYWSAKINDLISFFNPIIFWVSLFILLLIFFNPINFIYYLYHILFTNNNDEVFIITKEQLKEKTSMLKFILRLFFKLLYVLFDLLNKIITWIKSLFE